MAIHYKDPTSNPTTDDARLSPLPMVKVGDIWAVDVRENFPDRRTPTGDTYKERPIENITQLIIHHEAVPYIGGTTLHDLDEISKMYTYHTQDHEHLWPGIGYHFILSPTTGNLYLTGGIETQRYHALQANPYSIGICVLGLWVGDTVYAHELQQLLITRLRSVCENMHKALGRRLTVIAHSEVAPTQCPGDWWNAEMSNWFNTEPMLEVPEVKPDDPPGPGDIGIPEELRDMEPVPSLPVPPVSTDTQRSILQLKAGLAAADALIGSLRELADTL